MMSSLIRTSVVPPTHGDPLEGAAPQNRPSIDTSKPATTHVASEAD